MVSKYSTFYKTRKFIIVLTIKSPKACRNPGRQVSVLTKLCQWYSVLSTELASRNLLASKILRCLLDFWRICATLISPILNHTRSSCFCFIHLRQRSPHVLILLPLNVPVSGSRIKFRTHSSSFIQFVSDFVSHLKYSCQIAFDSATNILLFIFCNEWDVVCRTTALQQAGVCTCLSLLLSGQSTYN